MAVTELLAPTRHHLTPRAPTAHPSTEAAVRLSVDIGFCPLMAIRRLSVIGNRTFARAAYRHFGASAGSGAGEWTLEGELAAESTRDLVHPVGAHGHVWRSSHQAENSRPPLLDR